MALMYKSPKASGISGFDLRNRAAKRLAASGTKGDNMIAHMQTGELVVPQSMQSPGLMAEFMRTARRQKRDPMQYMAGSTANQRNPTTKMPMFADDFTGDYFRNIPIDLYLGMEQLYFPKKEKPEEDVMPPSVMGVVPDVAGKGIGLYGSNFGGGEGGISWADQGGDLTPGQGIADLGQYAWNGLTSTPGRLGAFGISLFNPALGFTLGLPGMVESGIGIARGMGKFADAAKGSGFWQALKDTWDYDVGVAGALGRNRDNGITNWDRANAQDQAEEAAAKAEAAWAMAQNVGGLGEESNGNEGSDNNSNNDFSGEGWF